MKSSYTPVTISHSLPLSHAQGLHDSILNSLRQKQHRLPGIQQVMMHFTLPPSLCVEKDRETEGKDAGDMAAQQAKQGGLGGAALHCLRARDITHKQTILMKRGKIKSHRLPKTHTGNQEKKFKGQARRNTDLNTQTNPICDESTMGTHVSCTQKSDHESARSAKGNLVSEGREPSNT
jgi:hypothetical protein